MCRGSALTHIERQNAVGRVSLCGPELQSRFLQAEDVREDVLVQASDELQLGRAQSEARLQQLYGDGHLTGAGIHREMRDLECTRNK